MQPTVSVIVVSYNSSDCVGDCLRSVGREFPTDQVIVVDNGSTDSTTQTIERDFSSLRLIRNRINIGFAAAVNQGIAEATTEYVLLINPDALLMEGFANALIRVIEELAHPAIIGGRLLYADGRDQPSSWKTPNLITLFLESFLPYKTSLLFITRRIDRLMDVETVSGACMAIRRSDVLVLGGFDERFFLYYEDFDLCIRVRKHGGRVISSPGLSAVHHSRKSTQEHRDIFFERLYTSKFRYYQKHQAAVGALAAWVIIVLGISVRIPVYALAGMVLSDSELLRLSKYHTLVLPKIVFMPFRKG